MVFINYTEAAEDGQVNLMESGVLGDGVPPTITSFEQYASLMFTTVFGLVLAVAVVKLAWAGFIYASSEIITAKSTPDSRAALLKEYSSDEKDSKRNLNIRQNRCN